jgi:hypothetical protein
MNRMRLPLVAAIVIALGAAAYAGETIGTITAIDNAMAEVTLDDGQTYMLGDPDCSNETICELGMFRVGDKVRIVWETIEDARVATEMTSVDQ